MTDPADILRALCDGRTPPAGWRRRIALLCEYAAALRDAYDQRTAQYRACRQGAIRDTKREGEIIRARLKVEALEERLGIAEKTT